MAADPDLSVPAGARAAGFDGWQIRLAEEGVRLPGSRRSWVGPAELENLAEPIAWIQGAGGPVGLGLFGSAVDEATIARLEPGVFRSLLLHGCDRLTGAILVPLARLGLQSLALCGCSGITGGLEALADAAGLRELWLSGCVGLKTRQLKALHRLRGLELLDLGGGLAAPGLFRWLTPLRELRFLDLSRGERRDTLGPELRALEALPALEALALRGCRLDERLLRSLLRLRALRRLDLTGVALEARNLERLRAARPELELLVDPPPPPPPTPRPTRSRLPSSPAPRGRVEPAGERVPEAAEPMGPFLPWPERAPRLAELHLIMPDERGNPCGEVLREDLAGIGLRYPSRALLESLASDDDPEHLASALLLLPPLLRELEPGAGPLTEAAIEQALRLLEDGREVSWHREGSGGSLQVAVLAAGACCQLLGQRRSVHDLGSELAILEPIVRAGIGRFDTVVPFVFSRLRDLHARSGEGREAFETFLGWLEATIADRDRATLPRIAAFELLERIERLSPTGLLGSAQAALARAIEGLAEASADAMADVRFRAAAQRKLAVLAPARLELQRQSGAIRARALPLFQDLLGPGAAIDPARAVSAAVGVDPQELLAAFESNQLDRIFAALAVAPYLGSGDEALAIARQIAACVGRTDRFRTLLEEGDPRLSDRLGDLAASQLLVLLRGRLEAHAAELLELGIRAGSQGPVGLELTAPPGLALLAAGLPASAAGDHVRAAIRAGFLDRAEPAEVRFALCLVDHRLQRELGLARLLDPDEDPELRALLGTLVAAPRMDELILRAQGCALPVSEPSDKLPLEWLRETLRITHHRIPVRRAVNGLVARLLPYDASGERLVAGAAELRALGRESLLREILDAPEEAGFGRHAATRWLSIAGASEDELRLARQMVDNAGWYGVYQGGPPRSALDRLLEVRSSENVADRAESELAPLLRIGFGAEGARRIQARAYALLARRHLAAGRLEMAARSTAYAAELDPLSLEAKRLLREL